MTHITDPRGTNPMTGTWQNADFAAISWDDLSNLVTMASTGQWDPVKNPALKETFDRAAALKDAGPGVREAASPEPQLPPGEFARVEIMGHDSVTGWVSDGTRAGMPVMIVRDWDGRVVREVPGHALYQFFPLATPMRRPDPLPVLPPDATIALPAADAYEGYYPGAGDEDAGPADAFAGRTEPASPF